MGQPDDAWLLQLSPEPQQGSGHGAPMSIAGIEADYAKIEEDILACFAPLLKHKWCIDELQGSITNGKIQVSDACQEMVDSITRETCWSKVTPFFEAFTPAPAAAPTYIY